MSGALQLLNASAMAAPRGHYSSICIAGGTAYISGQLPVDSQGNFVPNQPFDVQVKQTLSNLENCLNSLSIDKGRIAQLRVYVADLGNWQQFDRIYAHWIGDHRPARAVVGVNELHYGAALEIEAVAIPL